MKRAVSYPILMVGLGLSMATGCAHKEVIRQDDMKPAATAAKAKETTPAVTETAIGERPVKVAPASATGTEQLQHFLDRIYFPFDSTALTADSRQTLVRLSDTMTRQSGIKVRIEGNCDERGSDEYNLALGERRAQAAKNYLTTIGIAASRLSTISYGKEKPLVAGHDETAWAKNRRDDFVVITD